MDFGSPSSNVMNTLVSASVARLVGYQSPEMQALNVVSKMTRQQAAVDGKSWSALEAHVDKVLTRDPQFQCSCPASLVDESIKLCRIGRIAAEIDES